MVQGTGQQTTGAQDLVSSPEQHQHTAPTDLTYAGSTTTHTLLSTLPVSHVNAKASPLGGENQLSLARLSDQSHICAVDPS